MNHVSRLTLGVLAAIGILGARPVEAAIIGTNTPARPLTLQRVEALPPDQQPAWKEYLDRSDRQLRADQAVLQKELRERGIHEILKAPGSRSKSWAPLDQSAWWYAGTKARHTADVILSFQTPAGGWSKNMDMSGQLRSPGMHFAAEGVPQRQSETDFDRPFDRGWDYVGTFDNDATIT
ncbi:MAG TPA: pectate lyase, partial [Candidatus Paceibacterota bacterium]|nr:pectate lyase [Candidatus Paceibacterota bacterium]